MRKLISAISIVVLVLAAIACQDDDGPAVEQVPPAKYNAAEYTKYFVTEAIGKYDAEGLEATVDYYNTQESIDGQWYVFIFDENDVMLAYAIDPDVVGLHSAEIDGPNAYPAGDAVVAVADEDGAWFSYTFPNPALGTVQAKHSWMVEYDGMTFGSGWYERGPSKSDNPAYTQSFVERAINLYNAVGREATIEYYNTKESVDDQWYVFIIDEDGYTVGHHNPMFRGRTRVSGLTRRGTSTATSCWAPLSLDAGCNMSLRTPMRMVNGGSTPGQYCMTD